MMILRLLNPQGIAGLAASAILALLLIGAKIDLGHARKQSTRFEQLYRAEAKAHAETIANFKLATEPAGDADRANAARVAAAQKSITERIANDYEDRLADARARAERLRLQSQAQAGHGGRGGAPVPRLPAAAGGAAESAGANGLPDPERLIATEQAIQLDELIQWVRAQAAVDPNAPPKE